MSVAAGGGDGTIRIDAQMDSSGFEKESKRLESAITSLSEKINKIGLQLNNAIANGATQGSIDKLKGKMAEAADSMGTLRDRLSKFANTEVSTEKYENVTKAIQKTERELEKLYAREAKLKALGADASAIKWQNLQAEIEDTYKEVDILKEKLDTAKNSFKEVASSKITRGMTADDIAARSSRIAQLNAEVVNATRNFNEAKSKLDSLLAQDEKMTSAGADLGSKQWQSLQYDIEQAKNKLAEYNAQKQQLESSGGATFSGGETQAAQKMSAALDQASGKLSTFKQSLSMLAEHKVLSSVLSGIEGAAAGVARALLSVASSAFKVVKSGLHTAFKTLSNVISTVASKAISLAGSGLKSLASGLSSVASKALQAATSIAKVTGSTIVSGFKKLASAAISAGKALLSLGTANSHAGAGFNLSFKNVLRYGLGIRSLYVLFNKIRSIITSTLGDISKVDSGTNTAISSMITSFNRLKASFGAAFQPIVTVVAPYVNKFIQLLTQMLNKTNEFIAILTGQSYYMKANVTEVDYAKSLDTTTKSTNAKTDATKSNADATKKATSATNKSTKATSKANDEIERQLASFDHLNILSDNSKDSDPTGGLGSVDPSDVAGAGDAIADAANNAAGAIADMGKTTYEKVPVTGISDFLNKIKEAIENQDWDGVGRVIADKLNGIIAKIKEWVSWDNIGEKVTEIIDRITSVFNGLVDELDWTLLGETIGEAVNTIVYALDTLLEGVDWANLGTKIGEGLNGLVETVNWEALGSLIGKRFGSMLEVLYNIAVTFDWGKAGEKLAEGLNAFITTLESYFKKMDFKQVGTNLAEGINKLMLEFDWTAAGTFLGNRINDFTDAVAGLFETLSFAQAGFNLADGLNSLVSKINWEYIGKTLGTGVQGAIEFIGTAISTFKWVNFGTELAAGLNKFIREINWDYLGTVLKNGMRGAIDFIGSAISGFEWETLATSFSRTLNKFFADTSVWRGAGNVIHTAIDSFLNFRKIFLETLNVEQIASDFKVFWASIGWDSLASSAWDTVKTAFKKAGTFLNVLFADDNIDYGRLSSGNNDSALYESLLLKGGVQADSRSLGTKIGSQISKILSQIPWKSIASTMWENAKKALSGTTDFIKAILGVSESDVAAANNNEALAIGQKIGEKVANGIRDIPWDEFGEMLNTGITNLFNALTGFFQKLGEKDASGKSALQEAIEKFFSKIDWYSIAYAMAEAAYEAMYQLGNALFDVILDGLFASSDKQTEENVKSTFDSFETAVNNNKEDAHDILVKASAYIFSLTGGEAYTFGMTPADEFYKGLQNKLLDESGHVKSEFVDTLSDIIGTENIPAFESGEYPAEELYRGFTSAAYEGEADAEVKWTALFTQLISSPAESAEMTGKELSDTYVDGGVIPELEAKQADIEQAASETISNGLSGANETVKTSGEAIGGNLVDSVSTTMQNGQEAVTQATTDMVDSAVSSAHEHSGVGGKFISEKLWSTYISETLSQTPKAEDTVDQAFNAIWQTVDAGGAGTEIADNWANSFKSTVLTKSGELNSNYKDVVESMFGSVDVENIANLDGANFLYGLVQGMQNSSGETGAQLVGIIDSILTHVKTSPQGFDEHSPSKRSEEWGKNLLQGTVVGAESEESNAKSATTSVFENVFSGINSTFSVALLAVQKNMISFNSAVESYFKSGATQWNDALKSGVTELNGTTSTGMTALQNTILTGLSNIEKHLSTRFSTYKSQFTTGWSDINNTTATSFTTLQNTVLTGLTNLQNHFPTRFNTYRTQFTTGWNNIRTVTTSALNQMSSSVQSTLGNMQSTFSNRFSQISSTVSSQMNNVANNVRNGLQNAMNSANSLNWYSVGTNIVQGIYNGINGWWGWLNNTVWNLAIGLYYTARNALGIASPSKLFRDGVGKMLGLGVAVGMEDSEPTILDSVTEVTDAIMDKMNDTDTALDLGIHTDSLIEGLDGVLTTFSDRIGESFTDLIARLDAITGSVAFKMPAVAAGGVLPYSVSGNSAGALNGLSGQQNASDDLASVIIQSTNQAALAIVRAIERASESRSLSKREMTNIVVDEINKQTRALGKSPLLI